MIHKTSRRIGLAALVGGFAMLGHVARGAELRSLTVCADPGNMPLSNQAGEGFENKIAQVIGKALGTGVNYYWRPSIERGLMRTTLSEGNCDVWMDMASDTEGAEVLPTPLYRSTFVLAYRNDKGIDIKSLHDNELKKLRVGVFQVSAIREALSEHGVANNTVVHYLSHNADTDLENQPSYQVQQVIDGSLDIAAVWGPMAGYYKTIKHAPLIVQPVNLMEDQIPMEFDMTLAVPRGRPDIKSAVQNALEQHKDEIHRILVDFGVPLVQCKDCLVSGDLPSHGPYAEPPPATETAADLQKARRVRMAELKKWLAQGASPDTELADAIVAHDMDRVNYLLQHGAHVNWKDGEGNTLLVNAVRFGFVDVTTVLLERGADPNQTNLSNWTPLMYAAWDDSAEIANLLVKHGAKLGAIGQRRAHAAGDRLPKCQDQGGRCAGCRRRGRGRAGGEGRIHPAHARFPLGFQRTRDGAHRSWGEGQRSEPRRRDGAHDRGGQRPPQCRRRTAEIGRRRECAQRGWPHCAEHRPGKQQ